MLLIRVAPSRFGVIVWGMQNFRFAAEESPALIPKRISYLLFVIYISSPNLSDRTIFTINL